MKPPEINEFELSIFGRGFGESILMHIGNNEWIVIDSCLNDDKEPCCLAHLESIGVDPNRISHVIATHWDTDHIRGLSKTCEKSENCLFVFSQAMQSKDFMTLIFGASNVSDKIPSSTQEFSNILDIMAERISSGSNSEKFITASDYKVILDDTIFLDGKTINRKITALSPSTAAQMKSLHSIANLIPDDLEPLRNLRELRPNHTSIVLLVEIGDISILLGSDLEELGIDDDGWSAIINSRITLKTEIQVFKIPHHGSENGHHEKIWEDHIANDNISIITPFKHGKTNIPKDTDFIRIRKFSNNVYLAGSSLETKKKSSRDEKMLLRKVDKKIESVTRKLGRITLKQAISDNPGWSVSEEGETMNTKDIDELIGAQ